MIAKVFLPAETSRPREGLNLPRSWNLRLQIPPRVSLPGVPGAFPRRASRPCPPPPDGDQLSALETPDFQFLSSLTTTSDLNEVRPHGEYGAATWAGWESSAAPPRRSVRSSPTRTGHRVTPRPGSGLRSDINSCLSRPFTVPPQHPEAFGSDGEAGWWGQARGPPEVRPGQLRATGIRTSVNDRAFRDEVTN
jgi:hypothetical protein